MGTLKLEGKLVIRQETTMETRKSSKVHIIEKKWCSGKPYACILVGEAIYVY